MTVILQLKGGLGNQLFQYSFAQMLSKKLDKKLLINPIWFFYPKLNNYWMPFSIKYFRVELNYLPILKGIELELINRGFNSTYLPILKKYSKPDCFQFLSEIDYTNHHNLTGKTTILDGYFQDYSYFQQIRPILLEEFIPKKKLTTNNQRFLEHISTTNSVSIHYRGGVYIKDEKIRKLYPPTTYHYYKNAFNLINHYCNDAHFFIFTNDPIRVTKLLELGESVTIIDTKGPDYQHLYLMSQCKHNIVTNSTFSWWGAWLNNNPDKIVITPKEWEKNHANIPETWIQLDN